jgi:NAD(P)-dependent dehydrogenase (short-subunit alcohol dehydrogenase family)
MIKGGGGVIINTASGAGIEGAPRLGAYQAAKGGDASEFNSTVDFAMTFSLDPMRTLIRHYCPNGEVTHNA